MLRSEWDKQYKNNQNANASSGSSSPWGYTPSQAVADTVNGINSGAYKTQGQFTDTKSYMDALGQSGLSDAELNSEAIRASMAADSAGAVKRQNDLSSNGQNASDSELANMYLYNMFKNNNMSEDDQREVFRQLQASLPVDQQGNPVDITNAYNNYVYGDVVGYDENGQAVRSGNGYESRLPTQEIDEDHAFLKEAQDDFNRIWRGYESRLLAQGVTQKAIDENIDNLVYEYGKYDSNLINAYEGMRSAQERINANPVNIDMYKAGLEDVGGMKLDNKELRDFTNESFDANQVRAQQNPTAVIGIDNETGLYIFAGENINKKNPRYHLFTDEEWQAENQDGFRNLKNNPNAGYFQ